MDITNIKIGDNAPKAVMFDTYHTNLCSPDLVCTTIIPKDNSSITESPEGTWEVNDGWDVEFVDERTIKINKFMIDTWGIRHKVPSSSDSANKYKNMGCRIEGLSYVHENIIKANADSDEVTGFVNAYTGNGGYIVEWYPGQNTSGNYVKGLVIQGQMCYSDSWNKARDYSFAMGRAPWEIDGTRDRMIADGQRGMGMMDGGGCSAFCIGIFGGCQTAASAGDDSTGAYKVYDISDHPIYLYLDVPDYSQPIDVSSVECWDAYCGDTQVYHKGRTFENCWKKYGMIHQKTINSINGTEEAFYAVDMADVDSKVTKPILPEIDDLEEHLLPTKGSGIDMVKFNKPLYNDKLVERIKDYYANNPIMQNIILQEDGNWEYDLDNSTPSITDLFLGAKITGDFKLILDGGLRFCYLGTLFGSTTLGTITIECRNDTRISSAQRLFRNTTFDEVKVIDENGEPKRFAALDCSGMCEWSAGITHFPDIVDWSLYTSDGNTNIGWIFSGCYNLIDVAETESRDSSKNIIRCANVRQAFQQCYKLVKIGPVLDMSRIDLNNEDKYKYMFQRCDVLEDVRIKNLNGAYANFADDNQLGNIPNLSAESIQYLFDNLMDLTKYDAENTSPTAPRVSEGELVCPAKWFDNITDDMISAANAKGWTITSAEV